jgi:drug/metabolite transporter (DMT)-like permease
VYVGGCVVGVTGCDGCVVIGNRMAMVSNIAFAFRSIFRKNLSTDFKQRTKLSPANEHAITTMLSLLLLLPLVFTFESPTDIMSGFHAIADKTGFAKNAIVSGLCFYLYNELQNMVLGSLGPVPTAVGNTLKRVVIFVALYFFTAGETFPFAKVLGCAIAMAGCFGFAIFDSFKI